jgi:hypothetical protein
MRMILSIGLVKQTNKALRSRRSTCFDSVISFGRLIFPFGSLNPLNIWLVLSQSLGCCVEDLMVANTLEYGGFVS